MRPSLVVPTLLGLVPRPYPSPQLMNPDARTAEIDPVADLESVLERYAEEIRQCRYGSFRGVIRDGRVVVFAIEQEWRPHLDEERRAARHRDEGDKQ